MRSLSRSVIIKYIPDQGEYEDLILDPNFKRTRQDHDLYQLRFFYESDRLHEIHAKDTDNTPIQYKLRIVSTLMDVHYDELSYWTPNQGDSDFLSTDTKDLLELTLETIDEDEDGDAIDNSAFEALYDEQVIRKIIKTYRD